jgi:hypothetical protein
MEVPAQDKNNPERPSYTYTYPTTLSPSYVAMFESEYSPPSYVYDITKNVIAANLHIFYEGQPDEFVVKGRRWRLCGFYKDHPADTMARMAQAPGNLLIPVQWHSSKTEGNYKCTYFLKAGNGQWFGQIYTGSYEGSITLSTPIEEESKKEENKE